MYNYTILPFQTQSRFPFIKARVGVVPSYLDPSILDNYHSEQVTGILVAAPFLLFILWPAISLIRRLMQARSGTIASGPVSEGAGQIDQWISAGLVGVSMISFFTVLTFFYITMRYIADFSYPLVLLAVIGFWQGFSNLKPLIKRKIFSLSGILLSCYSIGISVLLAISGSNILLKTILSLFKHIMRFFL